MFCAEVNSNSDTLFCIEMGISVSKEHILSDLEKDGNKNKKNNQKRKGKKSVHLTVRRSV